MNTHHRGFGLIELIVTVAIVGILAAIALPAYSAFVIRARVSEGITMTGQCRIAVTEIYQVGLSDVAQPDGWGCNEGALRPTQFVEVIHTDAIGAITVTLNAHDGRLGGARGQDVVLTPVGGNLNSATAGLPQLTNWICSPGPTMPPEFLPSSCRP